MWVFRSVREENPGVSVGYFLMCRLSGLARVGALRFVPWWRVGRCHAAGPVVEGTELQLPRRRAVGPRSLARRWLWRRRSLPRYRLPSSRRGPDDAPAPIHTMAMGGWVF